MFSLFNHIINLNCENKGILFCPHNTIVLTQGRFLFSGRNLPKSEDISDCHQRDHYGQLVGGDLDYLTKHPMMHRKAFLKPSIHELVSHYYSGSQIYLEKT